MSPRHEGRDTAENHVRHGRTSWLLSRLFPRGSAAVPPPRPLRTYGRPVLSWQLLLIELAALALVVGFVRPVRVGVPTLRVVVETIMTLLALAAAALVRDQLLHSRRLGKLLFLSALVTLALTEFFANALPAALHVHAGQGFNVALPLGQLIAAGMLLASARTPRDQLVRSSRPVLSAILASVAAFAFAELAGLILRGGLLTSSDPRPSIEWALHRPLGFAILIATAGLLIWAALEFAVRGEAERSQTVPLLALGLVLLAAARLYYLALPTVPPEVISLREGLRLLGLGFIFGAALREHAEIRATAAHAAATAERLRVARDLHDGLAQDLAFIAAHAPTLSAQLGDEHPLTRAVRHALAISRTTISELSDFTATSPREMLEAIGYELGGRFGLDVVVDVAPDTALVGDAREQVCRIAREAIANAARHGRANHILVSLTRTNGTFVLHVVDDGNGLAARPGAAAEGFGIRSMRDRAAALGGSLTMRPATAAGTDVEVVFR